MAVSDANTRLMLEFDGLLGLLVKALLLDSPRREQPGGDAMQEATMGILQRLALFGPTAEALRADVATMSAIRAVSERGSDAAKCSAAGALFQLDSEVRRKAAASNGSTRRPKHVMVSYNWDHQPTILRVVAALQARGYDVWVDVEQMKGSTVDTMARAVENAAVMVMGVSRAYKESTNCRLEAQYGMQREVEAVPLLLEEGYQADGWLGMMMGTKLWFGLYGEALSSEGVFESRMEAVAFELGDRGRALSDSESAAAPWLQDQGVPVDPELACLKLTALRDLALEADVPPDAVDAALDAEDARSALTSLIMARQTEVRQAVEAAAGEGQAELAGLKLTALRDKALATGVAANAVDAALDAEDARAALVGLILAQRSAEQRERVE
jgi:hypothetical protein